MALRSLMAKKNLDEAKKKLDEARKKREALTLREQELETSIAEAETEEEKATVEAAVEEFEADQAAADTEIQELEKKVGDLERELQEVEEKANTKAQPTPADNGEENRGRKERTIMGAKIMSKRARELFGKMSLEERNQLFEEERVKSFLEQVRTCIKEKRALANAGLTIPDELLGLIRENIERYSKLTRHVFTRNVKGTGRVTVMGTIPEAVWTEMCAALNELDLSFAQAELDGYKVGGFIPVCNATLEDSDIDLTAEILTALGEAIGKALDKAILYGKGKSKKMPLGVLTRLAQTSEPSDYSANMRPWVDLHTSNIKALSSELEGLTLYRQLLLDCGAAKGKYSRGEKVWCMNETTYTALKAAMLSINAAGAVVSAVDGTLPVIGGIVEVLNFMPDNVIIGGYFDLYTLLERAGMRFGQSDQVRFLEEQTVFKGSARYDGLPLIAEAFVAIGLNGTTPSPDDVDFADDTANPDPSLGKLKGLTIDGVTLSATFDPDTTTYTGTTTKTSSNILATPQDGFDSVSITYNDNSYVPNGGSVKWAAGAGNVVKVGVKDSTTGTVTTYTVTVTKS